MSHKAVRTFLLLVLFLVTFATQANAVSLVSMEARPATMLEPTDALAAAPDEQLVDQAAPTTDDVAEQPDITCACPIARAPLVSRPPLPGREPASTPAHPQALQRPPSAASPVA